MYVYSQAWTACANTASARLRQSPLGALASQSAGLQLIPRWIFIAREYKCVRHSRITATPERIKRKSHRCDIASVQRVMHIIPRVYLEAAVVDDFLHPERRRRVDGRNEFVRHLFRVNRAAYIDQKFVAFPVKSLQKVEIFVPLLRLISFFSYFHLMVR